MHRIDGPGATVDNKFTDGDPVGGIQATVVTDDFLNDVQEELMTLLSAAGVTPVKGTQDQVLKSIRKISSGIVGQSRNLRMFISVASATATLTADEIIVETALGGLRYCLSGFNKTVNLASTGVGGMDTGAAPVSGFVALYAIYNPTTATSALLAVNATATVAPEVYGGANMPVGYTASALVSVLPTNSSGQILVAYQQGRDVFFQSTTAVSVSSQVVSMTAVSIASIVPKNAQTIKGWASITGASASNATVNISGSSTAIGLQQHGVTTVASGSTYTGNFSSVPLITAQTVYWTAGVGGGTFTGASLNISFYSF